MKKPKPRKSAADARAALIAATVRLLKRGGPRAVSVRAAASAAGVNHGLLHRYFGAKDCLLKAAVKQLSGEIHRGIATGAMSGRSVHYLRAHPELVQPVARVCLDVPEELLMLATPV